MLYLHVSLRLLSQGTLQKFVDDLFTAILSTSRPVPLAVKYFFDLLDEQALQHNINDPETIHIWKTNRYLARRQQFTKGFDVWRRGVGRQGWVTGQLLVGRHVRKVINTFQGEFHPKV